MDETISLKAIDCAHSALVVEDSPDFAFLVANMLEREGFAVDTVTSGAEAISYIDRSAPTDIVLTDLMLPYVDGFQIITRVRENLLWRATPVLVLSGKVSERDIVRAFEAGADDFVTKPYKPLELMSRIRRLVGLSVRRAASA